MKLKTFIRWMGNKSKHLRHILPYILPYIPDDYNTYYEPFIGSGRYF
jgi:DNA adenine methylase